MTIEKGKVVLIHFTLKDGTGEVIDTSEGRPPLPYLHGHGNLVPGVEEGLEGHVVGDKLDIEVPPEKGYGPREEDATAEVPRNAFPPDAHVFAGMQFQAEDENGNVGMIWVSEVRGTTIVIDRNHPLAGKTLHFSVEVTGIRDALPAELEHGHPHGEDGHDHHH
jgi:FKBP-type peptidyl-prolyl cis-trans isomerase SlyD